MGSEEMSTVLTGWTGTLLRALEDRDADVNALLSEIGIDASVFVDPEQRVPLAASTQLWIEAERITGDDAFGIDVSRYVTAATFHGLGQAFTTSNSLFGALNRVARFARVTADAAIVTTEIVGHEFEYTNAWRAGATRPSDMAVVATMAAIVRGARTMLGRDFAPTSVALRQPPPQNLARFEQFFGCDLRFDQAEHSMRFRLDDAKKHWAGAHETLAGLADDAVAAYLDTLDNGETSSTLTAAVAAILIDSITAGDPDIKSVASELAISGRTLQRRLANEGTTFREVVADTRLQLAKQLLAEGDLSVTQVGRRLGFSETAAFSRAFRRWTGLSPQNWQRSMIGATSS